VLDFGAVLNAKGLKFLTLRDAEEMAPPLWVFENAEMLCQVCFGRSLLASFASIWAKSALNCCNSAIIA